MRTIPTAAPTAQVASGLQVLLIQLYRFGMMVNHRRGAHGLPGRWISPDNAIEFTVGREVFWCYTGLNGERVPLRQYDSSSDAPIDKPIWMYENGNMYLGEWTVDEKLGRPVEHGFGISYINGIREYRGVLQIGHLKNGYFHGHGMQTWLLSSDIWMRNELEGTGITQLEGDRLVSRPFIYVGNYVLGLRSDVSAMVILKDGNIWKVPWIGGIMDLNLRRTLFSPPSSQTQSTRNAAASSRRRAHKRAAIYAEEAANRKRPSPSHVWGFGDSGMDKRQEDYSSREVDNEVAISYTNGERVSDVSAGIAVCLLDQDGNVAPGTNEEAVHPMSLDSSSSEVNGTEPVAPSEDGDEAVVAVKMEDEDDITPDDSKTPLSESPVSEEENLNDQTGVVVKIEDIEDATPHDEIQPPEDYDDSTGSDGDVDKSRYSTASKPASLTSIANVLACIEECNRQISRIDQNTSVQRREEADSD